MCALIVVGNQLFVRFAIAGLLIAYGPRFGDVNPRFSRLPELIAE